MALVPAARAVATRIAEDPAVMAAAVDMATKAVSYLGKRVRQRAASRRGKRSKPAPPARKPVGRLREARSGFVKTAARGKPYRRKFVPLIKRVKRLEKHVKQDDNDDSSIRFYYNKLGVQQTTDPGKCKYSSVVLGARSSITGYIDEIRVAAIDTSIPDQSLYEGDFYTGGTLTTFAYKASAVHSFRNNESCPVDMTIYEIEVRMDTSTSPNSYMDTVANGYGITNWYENPNHTLRVPFASKDFNKFFKIVKQSKVRLNGGDEYKYVMSIPWKKITTRDLGLRTDSYLKGYCKILCTRTQGTVSHDKTNTTVVDWGDTSVDHIYNHTYQIKVDGYGSVKSVGSAPTVSASFTDPVCAGPTINEQLDK